jgi:hypothetical protein
MQVMLVGVLSITLHMLRLNCTCTSAALVEKPATPATKPYVEASCARTQDATARQAKDLLEDLPVPVMTTLVPPAVLPAAALMLATLAFTWTAAAKCPQPTTCRQAHRPYTPAGMSGLAAQVTVSAN